ncbi:hypothetical protein COB21_01325 [Candidatus Aerophobetes bacterium]|uniref:Uncharacterized protein n=1 Tax=Aerophobetes bacterium TaxID=2030807 RepID=A0A2A4X714_UNCAE|nr:MAG: hypothetical protein COB21_01325 [Candidatus Aerophobetes bacterium]
MAINLFILILLPVLSLVVGTLLLWEGHRHVRNKMEKWAHAKDPEGNPGGGSDSFDYRGGGMRIRAGIVWLLLMSIILNMCKTI